MKTTLTIATRESPLALWQANWVKTQLEKLYPALTIRLLGVTTVADKMLEVALSDIGGKGLFVKELEQALLDQKADIAVHSMKDVPMDLPEGLCLPVMCQREDPRDAFVSTDFQGLYELPMKAVVGTSSLRRQCQLKALRPDLQMSFLRGNVNTRLNKLDQGLFSAIILAVSGLKRLGLENRIQSILSIEESLPAAGQGVLGIECRSNDAETQEIIAPLRNKKSTICVTAERAMCRKIGGGCQAPVAAYADMQDEHIVLRGLVGQEDGSLLLRASRMGSIENPEQLGQEVANDLLSQGAEDILSCLKKS